MTSRRTVQKPPQKTKSKQKKKEKEREGQGNLGAVWLWIPSGAPGDLAAWPSPPATRGPGPPFPAGGRPALLGWGVGGILFSSDGGMFFSSFHSDPPFVSRVGVQAGREGFSGRSQTIFACRPLTTPGKTGLRNGWGGRLRRGGLQAVGLGWVAG